MAYLSRKERDFAWALGLSSLLSLFLFGLRVFVTGSHDYSFIPGNLALAWVSLLVIVVLAKRLKTTRWQSGQNILLTIVWLAFLPNAWYVLTDFIHVYPNGEISQLYDIVLISTLVFSGFAIGLTGLSLFYKEICRRYNPGTSILLTEAVILLSSFAVFLGRDLRWNTWDVLTNPGSVVVNVSDQVTDPLGNQRGLNVTILFFILISFLYWALYLMFRRSRGKLSN